MSVLEVIKSKSSQKSNKQFIHNNIESRVLLALQRGRIKRFDENSRHIIFGWPSCALLRHQVQYRGHWGSSVIYFKPSFLPQNSGQKGHQVKALRLPPHTPCQVRWKLKYFGWASASINRSFMEEGCVSISTNIWDLFQSWELIQFHCIFWGLIPIIVSLSTIIPNIWPFNCCSKCSKIHQVLG